MINIKDKLSRTNLLIPRTQDAVADYVTEDVFYNQITEINKELDELEDGIRNSYSTGVSEGVRQQKAKLESVTITENGEYIKEDGYNKISVNVAVEGNYDEGYEDGIAEGVRQQKAKLGTISITENGEYNKEDGYDKISVNVKSKINVQEYGLRFAYSTISTVPEWAVLDGIDDAENLFYNCTALTSVPYFDASKIISTKSMFYGCISLTDVPLFDTSKVLNAEAMFYDCSSLTSVPQFDFSSLINAGQMFYNTSKLQSVPLLDFGNVTVIYDFFSYFGNNNLTDLGGFKNLKIDWDDNYGLSKCPNLTYESVMNVITNLYDFRANGDNKTTKTLKISSNSMELLSDDDKALATNKGWTLTA